VGDVALENIDANLGIDLLIGVIGTLSATGMCSLMIRRRLRRATTQAAGALDALDLLGTIRAFKHRLPVAIAGETGDAQQIL